MIARGVHASQHELVPEDESPDQRGTWQFDRAVAARDASEHVHAVDVEGIQQVELQRSDSSCVDDQRKRSEMTGVRLASVEVMPFDAAKPLWASGAAVHDVEPIDVGAP